MSLTDIIVSINYITCMSIIKSLGQNRPRHHHQQLFKFMHASTGIDTVASESQSYVRDALGV